MLFSSVTFLYCFLPVVLTAYFVAPKKLRNFVLFISSLIFYFVGEPKYSVLLMASVLFAYAFGLLIDKYRGKKASKILFILSISVNLTLLLFFKYTGFFIDNLNLLFKPLSYEIKFIEILLPIGISFYTFQILSYTVDLYLGKVKVQRNFISFATYVIMFPQLIAGPIVRYETVENELIERKTTLSDFAYGIKRFVFGLAKKVIIADSLGLFYTAFSQSENKTVLFYWLGAIAFMLQIYYDFSAYSDMAIGLGRILGFHFLENFNYPYVSSSITEFWRRWHISLGTFFRDYLYIPLGGNRVKKWRWLINIFIVWLLTGLWHGAQWNFILWGFIFGVFLALEKTFLLDLLKKIPKICGVFYTLLIVLFGFVIFNAADLSEAFQNIGGMLGFGVNAFVNAETVYYLKSFAVLFVISVILSTPLMKNTVKKLIKNEKMQNASDILEIILIAALLFISTAFIIDSSANPFIYFRF